MFKTLRIFQKRRFCLTRVQYTANFSPHASYPNSSRLNRLASKLVACFQSDQRKSSKECRNLLRDYWALIPTLPRHHSMIHTALAEISDATIAQLLVNFNRDNQFYCTFLERELIYNAKDLTRVSNIVELVSGESYQFTDSHEVLDWCVTTALKMKRISKSLDLYILYYRIFPNECPNPALANKIISALSFRNPPFDVHHLRRFVDVVNLLQLHDIPLQLNHFQLLILCDKALSMDGGEPLLSKKVLNILLGTNILPQSTSMNSQIRIAYKLIDKDYKINNAAGVYLTWTKIQDFYTSLMKHDSRILYKVFKLFTQNNNYRSVCKELIWKLSPEEYCNDPLLLPVIIHYTTETNSITMAQELLNSMKLHTTAKSQEIIWSSKRFLSALLRLHLKFYDSSSVDKVIKRITELYGSLSAVDYNSIVCHLLQSEKMESVKRAIKLLDTVPKKDSFRAYTSIINKLVEWDIASKNVMKSDMSIFLDEILHKLHGMDPHHVDSLWAVVASLYIKKICSVKKPIAGSPDEDNLGLNLAKFLFLKSDKPDFYWDSITVNPFLAADPTAIKLKVTKGNRFVILRNIALTGLKNNRRGTFLWSCSMLYRYGMPVDELVLLWNRTLKHQFRNSQFKTRKEITDTLQEHGVESIAKMLL
ncbi:Cbp1p KNAG_0H03830 [Huiozyma naganishii CBS 8797]|uniref:Uncharacterized protein n=1 Tax=Huiozyma naganishii (strain ATCC MYA-139 / BCRC 22969 / CBS 8797 / KCTC 17520 / NBRC 10181 / NCYC 3082 / Yp74L-3) TaxID=1071383 RepID=J7S228_HUIN7|nr:hypothetical protein KNAG_0H03830 [Kazachstania naganishii CBS 8797]CCK71797.1 hypothetical protein KNAG_0H03830 [Kazachstania naganishii CBS 8797]